MTQEANRRPRWESWKYVGYVTLWEGVLLAHDLEPDDHPDSTCSLPPELLDKVMGRLQLAERNVCPGGALLHTERYSTPDTKVPMRDFARWARHVVHWDDMPAELSEIAGTGKQVAAEGDGVEKRMSTKERNYLLRIIRVLADMANLPTEPHKAAQIVEARAQAMKVDLRAAAVAKHIKSARDAD
jgi:hypothetical protein